jgi:cytochrome c oxidase subunit IV
MTNTDHSPARWLALLTGLLALIQAGAVSRALQAPPEVSALASVPMPLEAVASVVWGLLFVWVTIQLLRRYPDAQRHAAWVLIGWIVYSLARLVMFVRADYDQQRLPFLIIIASMIVFILTVYVVRSATQRTENSGNGRKSQD